MTILFTWLAVAGCIAGIWATFDSRQGTISLRDSLIWMLTTVTFTILAVAWRKG
jgi:hypothetical protein